MRKTVFNHRGLVALALSVACAPAAVSTSATMPGTPTVDARNAGAVRLDRHLSGLEALGFSGAAIVEHKGKVVLRRGYGLADRETRVPYTPATVQNIASITKQFTGAAILLLADRGLLSIDAPMSTYLGDVPADKRGITLHHLLTHQSGFPSALGPDSATIDAASYVDLAMRTPLEFAPGTRVQYSNVGFSLLGIIIQRVTGRDYEEFLRKELLLPAGLTETGVVLPPRQPTARAVPYKDGARYAGPGVYRNYGPNGAWWHLRANGDMETNVDDMHRWLSTLRGRGPLRPETVARWTTAHAAMDKETSVGYGWMIMDTEMGQVIMHTGGGAAFASFFVWMPKQELFMYAHSNSSRWPIAAEMKNLMRTWFDPEPPRSALPPVVTSDPTAKPETAAGRVGRYTLGAGSVTLKADDIRLDAELTGQDALNAFFADSSAPRDRLAGFTARASQVVNGALAGDQNIFVGQVRSGTDPVARAKGFAAAIKRPGTPRSVNVIGTAVNKPGMRFEAAKGFVTYVDVEYDGEHRILSMLWNDDDTYLGTFIGPVSDVPVFVLVPAADGSYTAVEAEAPWRTRRVTFDGRCLTVQGARACR